MDKKVKIILTEHQRNLLVEEVKDYILNTNTDEAISNAIAKNGQYTISLTAYDLDELIGSVCFASNHEDKNNNLIFELDELIDYLEVILGKC